MKITLLKSALILAILFQSCSRTVFTNESYIASNNLQGKKVAILPAEVEFTGRLPKGLTIDKKKLIEEKEGTEIQNLVYREYLYRSKRARKKQLPVELMSMEMVNSKLKQKGITTRDSWGIAPDSLAKLTGADLVVRLHVKKDRIMSDAASLGVGVATSILGGILNKDGSGAVVGTSGRTYNISFDATLMDGKTGEVVSKVSKEGSASWSNSPESVIRHSASKLVRRGPVYARP